MDNNILQNNSFKNINKNNDSNSKGKKKALIFAVPLVALIILAIVIVSFTGNNDKAAQTVSYIKSAMEFNPGESINPTDKGNSVSYGNFKYTLLDVRKDNGAPISPDKSVILTKLEVENITQSDQVTTSQSDVELILNKPDSKRNENPENFTKAATFYSQSKVGVLLSGDINKGDLKPGDKVVGYYIFEADDSQPLFLVFGDNSTGKAPVLKIKE